MNLAYENVTPIRPELRAVEQRVADTDDGFMRVANELTDSILMADLTARQLKIMLAIMRKTYGFNKSLDRITNTQIAAMTGIHHTHVCSAKRQLIDRGFLISNGTKIGINKFISMWDTKGVSQSSESLAESAKQTLAKAANTHSPKQLNTKDNIQKTKDIKHTSENSGESSDERLKSLPVVRPDAAVHSPKGDKWGTADDLLAAQWIFSRVQVITPTAQQPNWPAWANDIRLMRDSLKVSHREICEVFTWANGNQFWQTNILSPSKLRKQWATLKAQMSQPARNAPSSSQQQIPHWNDRREWEENFI
ncbi:replication protein [Pantoea septica]|uniref:replication protein n=1 Tax=Pantoea septica TaxID=472695 RepID=UPI00289E4046|nr:replication protein [Pantoea septica]